jgi:hypothetical protein
MVEVTIPAPHLPGLSHVVLPASDPMTVRQDHHTPDPSLSIGVFGGGAQGESNRLYYLRSLTPQAQSETFTSMAAGTLACGDMTVAERTAPTYSRQSS